MRIYVKQDLWCGGLAAYGAAVHAAYSCSEACFLGCRRSFDIDAQLRKHIFFNPVGTGFFYVVRIASAMIERKINAFGNARWTQCQVDMFHWISLLQWMFDMIQVDMQNFNECWFSARVWFISGDIMADGFVDLSVSTPYAEKIFACGKTIYEVT